MLCGLSCYLVNWVLNLGVQGLPAQLRLGKALVTLGNLQEESKRAVDIEDDDEGQGGSGPAAKLRLRKPLPAGQGPWQLETITAPWASAVGTGSWGADTHRGLLTCAKSAVLDGGLGLYSDLLLRGYVCGDYRGKCRLLCCARWSGY